MIPRLQTIWENIRSSLWAVPLAMTCVAAALAVSATRIRLGQGSDPVWFLYSGGAEQAPQFLSHLVTAMITMATLAISITMVVLALAAQQLGPRLIYNFMRDWHTQYALGLFVATVVYLLLVLRSSYGLQSGHQISPSPSAHSSCWLAWSFRWCSYIISRARSLPTTLSWRSERGSMTRSGDCCRKTQRAAPARANAPAGRRCARARQAGRLRRGDRFRRCDRAACDADVAVEFDVRAGHHVILGAVVGLGRAGRVGQRRVCANRSQAASWWAANACSVQDLEFSIRHLVEIAVRALSPGINDPYTAMAVVDRLSLSIALVMRRGTAEAVWRDEQGRVRIVAPVSTFEGIVDAAFHQIRQHATRSPDVLIRIVENLVQLMQDAGPEQRAVLAKHLELVLNAGRRNIEEKDDLKALEERAEEAQMST